jgi:hypothetical protein
MTSPAPRPHYESKGEIFFFTIFFSEKKKKKEKETRGVHVLAKSVSKRLLN